jgi:ABC-type multidrug transport system fused ATPase/permease subunit
MTSIARGEIANFATQGWALAQTQLTWMDLMGVWFIYSQMRPNRAILLLAVLSLLKAMNIVWFSLIFDYQENYSDYIVTIMLVGLDVGWFFNDHIASLSTLQKVNSLPQSRVKKAIWNTVMGISLILGAYLRVARSQCRFNGDCRDKWPLQFLDSIIAFNVIATELFMVSVLLAFFYSIYKQSMLHSHVQVMSQMIEQGLLRVVILLPLGILEIVAYAIPETTKSRFRALQVFLEVGIYARHMYPTFLAVAIAMTRLRVYKSTHSQSVLSQTKSDRDII